MPSYSVTVREEESGEAFHLAGLIAADHPDAAFRADHFPSIEEWTPGPAPIPVFTLQCFDHGVEVDSNWSSLELAQLAAVTITTETEDGANEGRNPEADDVKATVTWTHEEQSPSWRATSPEDVGFVITRTILDQPHQF
jgi:hypothetical protein